MTIATRKGLLAKIHIAKAQLGLDDDAYRAVLAAHGVESSKDLDLKGLETVLTHMEKLGWQAKVARSRKRDAHGAPKNLGRGQGKGNAKPYDRSLLLTKIEALLADKGAAQDEHVPWDYAAAILKRMYKLDRLEWANTDQLRGVMVALMKGGKRKKRVAPPVPEVDHAAT
jgi:phage gp16-like protein